MTLPPADREPISSQMLQEGLLEYGICTEEQLIGLLGEARHSVSLNSLELILVNKGVISNDRLLLLKGALTGQTTLDDGSLQVRPSALPAEAVRATGAMVLDRDPLTVVFVEDAAFNVESIAQLLARTDFEIWLMTAVQFDQLYRSYYQNETISSFDAVRDLYEILDEAVRRNASDIHLTVGEPPALRVDGRLFDLPRQPLDAEWFESELPKLISEDKIEIARTHHDVDSAYSYGASRFRVNIGADLHGFTAALRKIPTRVPTLDEIGLPAAVRRFAELERGLVLVTGPTGSGKSTTLAALLAHIAATYGRHIITLEDPIEFHIPRARSIVHQRELGESFETFPGGLRQALRQDPDVILVGELRDLETMKTALTAAETGHLVFGTLHTFDASSTVSRLVSSFLPEEQAHARSQLAYILKGIVSQALLARATGKGRAAAFEVMVSTPAIQNNLSKLDGHHQLHQTMETSLRDGMVTMEMSLVDLVKRGVVREEEARFYAPDKDAFDRRLAIQ